LLVMLRWVRKIYWMVRMRGLIRGLDRCPRKLELSS
jgi:hypothetical protein